MTRARIFTAIGALLILVGSTALVAEGRSQSLLRTHKSISLTAHGASTADSDFVLAMGSASRARGTLLGYSNSNYPGEGVVLTSFYRGVFTRRALAQLQGQIEDLNPAVMPGTCTLDSGAFLTGTYELTLYALGGAERKVITVIFDQDIGTAAQCPENVGTLLQLIDDFIGTNAHRT